MTIGTNVWQFWQLFRTRSRPAPAGKISSMFTLLADAPAVVVPPPDAVDFDAAAGAADSPAGAGAEPPPHAAVRSQAPTTVSFTRGIRPITFLISVRSARLRIHLEGRAAAFEERRRHLRLGLAGAEVRLQVSEYRVNIRAG